MSFRNLCIEIGFFLTATQQVIKTGEDPTSASESLQLEKRWYHLLILKNEELF